MSLTEKPPAPVGRRAPDRHAPDRPVRIRRAHESDGPAIADIFIAARARMDYLPALHTEAETRAFIRDVVCSHKVWLAEDDGGDAGALGFAACKDGFLHHLYVSPGAQNCGAGGRLLRQVKTAMPDGFRLWCFQANRGARRFYERHGLYCARLTPGGGNEENLPDALYVWPGIETKETEP